jgi:hypothetical protein
MNTPTFEDDLLDHQIEAQAAEERQSAVLTQHAWNGRLLHPFSIRRETLYFRLRAVNDCLPLHVVRRHPEAFLSEAMIILWLCAHEPQDWQPLRGSNALMMAAIETWAEENIAREQQTQAVELALEILRLGDCTRAVPRPAERTGDDLGNLPCP